MPQERKLQRVGRRVPLTETIPDDLIAVETGNDSPDSIGLYRVVEPGDEEGQSGVGLRLDVEGREPYRVNFTHPFAQTVLVVGHLCRCQP